MSNIVTNREELAPLTPEETIEGYTRANENVVQSLAAHADATDCVYFEGALIDRTGGVIRVEAFDVAAVMLDLAHVVPGYRVTGIEPLLFSIEEAVDDAIAEGKIAHGEWGAMSEADQEELLDELRRDFREENGIQQSVDEAMRIELVADRV